MENYEIQQKLTDLIHEDSLAVSFVDDYVELKNYKNQSPAEGCHTTLCITFNEDTLRSLLNRRIKVETWQKKNSANLQKETGDVPFEKLFSEGKNYVCKVTNDGSTPRKHIRVKRKIVELLLKCEKNVVGKKFARKTLLGIAN